MNTELERRKQEITRSQGRRKLWQRIVSALAAVVMFVTTYVLILPVEAQNRTFCEQEAHEHSAENGCYVETKTLKCEEEHEHTDECYITLLTLICQHEEHIHNKECYADKMADIETQADWEASIKAAKLTGNWSEDILAIANTQLGYRESDKNYIVNEKNEIQGYNRYAAWVSSTNAEFGQYSPWSAAFVAFCLHFAKVDEAELQRTPYPAQWGELMKAYEKLNADAGKAQPGDILFIDANDDEIADRVGIVVENTDGKIKTVEGDLNNSVAYAEYRLPAAAGAYPTDRTDVESKNNKDFSSEKSTTGRTVGKIIGFVAMPENPNYTAPTPDPSAPGNRINETAAPEATAEPGGDRETAAPTQEPINKTTPEPHGELEAEYNYSLLGKTELTLSKMFAELNIPRSVLLVDSVLSSSPALVGVRRTAEDWLISSAVSFTSSERLSIEFINGEATLIHLTDIPARGIGESYQPGTAEVTAVNVRAVTGTLPFDADNNPGNDQNATNDVVRSYDTVFYKVGYTLNIIDKYGTAINGFKKANLYIEATLPLTEDKAVFDLDAMPWLTNPQITQSGGSQILTGYYAMDAGSFDYVVPSTGTLSIAVYIKNVANGETVQPSFSIYLDVGGKKSATPQTVTVSSAPSIDVTINNTNWTNNASLNGTVGVLLHYGFRVSAFNTNTNKGRRGCYFGVNEVAFDMTASISKGNTVLSAFQSGMPQPMMFGFSLINGSNYYASGSWVYGSPDDRAAILGLTSLPYSNRSSGNNDNACFNSGTMSASVDASGFHIKFTGIGTDLVFPSKTASGSSIFDRNTTSILATGFISVLFPIGWIDHSYIDSTITAQANINKSIRVNGVTAADANSSDASNVVKRARNYVGVGVHQHAINAIGTSAYVSPGMYNIYRNQQFWLYPRLHVNHGLHDPVGRMTAADLFVKLYGGIEYDSTRSPRPTASLHASSLTLTTIFVAKSDGKGWANYDELERTNMVDSNLRFYSSMNALKAALGQNAVCIGILFEVRNPNNVNLHTPTGMSFEGICEVEMPVKIATSGTSSPPANGVAYALLESRGYTSNMTGKSRLNGAFEKANVYAYTENDLNAISPPLSTSDNHFPRKQDGNHAFTANGGLSRSGTFKERVRWVTDPIWPPIAQNNTYNWFGNCFFILGERPSVSKSVSQLGSGGQPRSIFNTDIGERLVDYTLAPRVIADASGSLQSSAVTTVTVTDILPKGLECIKDPQSGKYVSYIGGEYVQPTDSKTSGTISGNTTPIMAGNTASGISTSETKTGNVTFTATKNANGTTTLKWVFTNVGVGEEMPKIYYSAFIGAEGDPLNDVQDGTLLLNQATMSISNGMTANASATITVQKLESATLIKRVSTPTPDVNGDVVYTIDYINDSTEKLSSIDILDILPFNNDPRGSSFHGSYTVDTVTVERMNEAAGSYAMGYTTDTAVQSYVGNMYAAGFSPSLTNASASVSGMTTTFTLPANTTPTMLAFTGSRVGAGAVVRITVTLHPSGNKNGDVYFNDAAYNTATIPAPVYAVPVSARVVQQHMSLTVTEEIIGGDASTAFPFTVAVTDGTGNNIYQIPDSDIKVYDAGGNDITPATITRDANGNPVITLGNGDYVEISNIPANYIATVTETGYDGYSVDISGDGTATAADSGITQPIVMNGDKTVHYLNERSTVELTISKTVVGAGNGPFGFTVTFTDGTGAAVNIPQPAANSGYTVTNNVATFDLNKDGSVTITGIPVDTVATIVETSHNGYTVQYNFSDGTPSVSGDTAEVTISDDLTVTCINNAGFELPHTGGGGTLILTFSGAILMATALTYGMAVRRRRERREFTY